MGQPPQHDPLHRGHPVRGGGGVSLRDRGQLAGWAIPPTAAAGRNEFATVINALKDAGLENVDPGRYTATADQLEQPGQVIEIGDVNAFVFIYPDADPQAAVAAREADASDLDPATVKLSSRTAERPLNDGLETHVFQASNVIVVLAGGDDALVSTVQNAIESLP